MDHQDFNSFYNETYTVFFGYVMRLCENRSLAEDIVQEAYLSFLNKPPREDHFRAQKAYLYTIATRMITDHFRGEIKKRELIIEMKKQATEGGVELESDPDLQSAINQLSQHEKSLLWLAYVDGYMHKEIATIMNLKPSGVRVLLFRARQRLKGLLKRNLKK